MFLYCSAGRLWLNGIQGEYGRISSLPVLAGDTWVAAYEVDKVPLGQLWLVQPSLLGGALAGPPPGFVASPAFDPQQVVELTPTAPAANGVDFAMSFAKPPR